MNMEKYFVYVDGCRLLEYDTYDCMELDVKELVKEGTPPDDIVIIRGVAMRVKLSIEEA